jgi:hypothetical protein
MYRDEDDAFDERGLLKHGHTARIRMTMRDAMRERDRPRVHDGFGRPVGNRPGFLIDASRTARDARELAYRSYDDWACNRWRDQDEDDDPPNGAPAGAYPYRPELVGTSCTINGAPGQLVKQGDWLVCKPTTSFNGSANGNGDEDEPELAQSDADTMRRHKAKIQDEYARYDAEIREAYKRI